MKIFIIGHKSPDLDTIASAVSYAELLRKLKRYESAELIPTRAGEPNKETQFVFKKFAVEIPKSITAYEIDPTDAIILTDHNEESQRHEKIPADQIIEIVDHHKINLSFASPVRIDVKPFGATSTLVYELFDMYGINPSGKAKGLILASILSDTQGLKSKTTTGYDSEVAHKLAEDLQLDLEKLTFELFEAKSDITGMSPMDIAKKDYKIFTFGKMRVFINLIETVEPGKVLEQKEKLLEALEEIKAAEGVGQAYMVVTDIVKINSRILYTTEEEKAVVETAFTTHGHKGIADIGPRMSRKKEISPEIEKAILSQ